MEPTALLLLALSIVCSTARAVFSKKLGALSDGRRGFYLTQAVLFAVAAAVLLTLNVRSIARPSQTAVLLAVAYGVLTVLSQWMYTLSLTRCPVSVCAMVYSFGFILPTVFGTVVWREPVNAFKIVSILLCIGTIFLAMAAGLITGMGYLAYAVLFTLILGLALLLCQLLIRPTGGQSTLRITVPEDLDYTRMFDDLFARYTKDWETVSVKTTNMGSLFRMTYRITLKNAAEEKEFIDALRCRNGNLEVSISQEEADAYAL